MSYAALDFFLSDNFVIKPKGHVTDLPPDGDVLADYILARQYDSFWHIGDEFVLNALRPLGQAWGISSNLIPDYHAWVLPPHGPSYLYYKQRIDANECRPLALLPATGLIGHQVLGIGYTDDPNPEQVLIHIYDPNHPKEEMVLKLNASQDIWERREYNPANGTVGKVVKSRANEPDYRAWAPADGYRFREPDIYATHGTINLSGRNLQNWKPPAKEDLTKYMFIATNFSGNQELDSCDFGDVPADRANFSRANASTSDFTGASLVSCNFSHANLRRSTFTGAAVTGANFSNANLADAVFENVNDRSRHTFFDQARLNNTKFPGATLHGRFIGASIVHSDFSSAKLDDADFSSSAINNTSFRGAELGDSYWRNVTINTCNFRSTDKKVTMLEHADFTAVTMNTCDFTSASLKKAKFVQSALASVQFDKGKLDGADFSGATLRNVQFTDADIQNARFIGANLKDIDFTNVKYMNSHWTGATIAKPYQMSPSMFTWLYSRGVNFV